MTGPGEDRGYPQQGMGYPQDRLCLDRLCRGQYASCSFLQEDFLTIESFNPVLPPMYVV